MLLMDCPSIRGEEIPDYAKIAHGTFCIYIYMHTVKAKLRSFQDMDYKLY